MTSPDLPQLPSIPSELRERIVYGENADRCNAAVEYASAVQIAAYRCGMKAAAKVADEYATRYPGYGHHLIAAAIRRAAEGGKNG